MGERMSFIGANAWTALSIVLGVFAAYFLAQGSFAAGAMLFAVAAACDMIDGAVARHLGTAGSKGAFIDTITDRYVEFFVILGLFFASLPPVLLEARLWLFIYLFGSLMTTYAKAAAREKGLIKKEMHYGILERAERLIILLVGMLLAQVNPAYLVCAIAILAILANITALQRIRKAFEG